MTDIQIIKGVNQKMPDAFKKIFDMLFAPLCFYANRIIDDREEAKDLAAKSFAALWEKQADFEDLNHVKAFLFTVTRNACITHVRNSKVKASHLKIVGEQYLANEKYYDRAIDETEIVQQLYSAINTLPDRCREAFILTHLEGLSRSEAATRLGISENTIKNHLQVAKSKLRNILGDEKRLSLALLLIHYTFLKN